MKLAAAQNKIDLKVYQGESRIVAENILLGNLSVPLPRMTRNEQAVEVRFTYDINGLLEVEALTMPGKTKRSLVIEQVPGAMNSEEIRQSLSKLEKLKIHPRDQAANKMLFERLKRMFEQNLGDRREWISQMLRNYEVVLERQDPREIQHTHDQIVAAIDQFEGAPVL